MTFLSDIRYYEESIEPVSILQTLWERFLKVDYKSSFVENANDDWPFHDLDISLRREWSSQLIMDKS